MTLITVNLPLMKSSRLDLPHETSLITVYLPLIKPSKMVMLDEMTLNQIKWCKEKGMITNLRPDIADTFHLCAFYAIIPPELMDEFSNI